MASPGQVKAAAYGAIGAGKFGQKSGLGFIGLGIAGGIAAATLGAVAPVAALVALPLLCLGMFQRVSSKKIEQAGWTVLDATKGKGPRRQATGKEGIGRGFSRDLAAAVVDKAMAPRRGASRRPAFSLNHGQGGHVLGASNAQPAHPRRFGAADFKTFSATAASLESLRGQQRTAHSKLRATAKEIGPQHVGKTLAARTPLQAATAAKSEALTTRLAHAMSVTPKLPRQLGHQRGGQTVYLEHGR